MITVQNLKKNYGHVKALNDVSFKVNKGEILALLGPNGAGKTTAMRIITGFLSATSGDVEVDGISINDNTIGIQKRIGYLPENTPLYMDLNVYEHLDFSSEVYGIRGIEKTKAINDIVKLCGLQKHLYFNISELSKGYKQRVGLAQAIIHDPDILILDEPTTGLDPNQIIEIRDLIKTLGKKKTVILSTHIMQEVEAMADRVVVINKGEIVAEGTPNDLMKGSSDTHKTRITVKGSQKSVISILEKIKKVNTVKKVQNIDTVTTQYLVISEEDIRSDINKALAKADLDLLEMSVEKQSMESVFHDLTRGR